MIKQSIKALMLLSLLPLIAYADLHFEEIAPPSLADHTHLSHKDPVDGGWLPQLTGLPNKDQVDMLTQHVLAIIEEDQDKQCTAIDLNLRMMIFQHFLIYQHIVNSQDIYFDEQIAQQWAHVLAMILKESSGDSTNITDMLGHSISTFEPKTNLQQWNQILNLTKQKKIELNYQTNFGLTQTSADRLFSAFNLAQDQKYNTEFLEGKEGAATPRKLALNTAIAIRRLIWFYQDFSQGRIVDEDKRIHQDELIKPELFARYQDALKMAVLYCGTKFMFREGYFTSPGNEIEQLENAVASIAYCKLGSAQSGYGVNTLDQMCFAEWVTLCPALNIDIATLTPLSYFATRNQKPVCENTFKRLLNQNPDNLMNQGLN